MAANPFASNRRVATGPKHKPYSDPKNPVRHPPSRRPKNIHPWRPVKKKGFKPFGGKKPKYPPFGKRVPGSPVMPGRWVRSWGRVSPWVGVATVAGGWLWATRSIAPFYDMSGWTQVCSQPGPRNALGGVVPISGTPLCGTGGQPYFYDMGDPILPTWKTVYFGMSTGTQRCTWLEQWRRTATGLLKPLPLLVPWFPSDPWTPIFPEPLPIAPWIYPGADPNGSPRNNPSPHGDPHPQPNPQPEPKSPPVVRVSPGLVPAVTISPGTSPGGRITLKPDLHEKRPPTKDEREKKKKLNNSQSLLWAAWLARVGGSYTELDDFVAAIYKGLPWKLRRWRGQDGVWRDRDYTTAQRSQRIFNLMGSLNVIDAISAVMKNEGSDRLWGQLGNTLVQGLQSSGMWAGLGGFQLGSSKLAKDKWEMQKKATQEEFARTYRNQYYSVRVKGPDGEWRTELRLRPKTQIPWLRKQSQYKRVAMPTRAEWWNMSYGQKQAWLNSMAAYRALTREERYAILVGARDPSELGISLRSGYYYGNG